MSEEMLLNELVKLGWKSLSRAKGIVIFSFDLGIRHCMIDIIYDRIYPYTNAMEPSYLTPVESYMFAELAAIYHREYVKEIEGEKVDVIEDDNDEN